MPVIRISDETEDKVWDFIKKVLGSEFLPYTVVTNKNSWNYTINAIVGIADKLVDRNRIKK